MQSGATLDLLTKDVGRLAGFLEASDVGLWEFEHASGTARWSPQLERMLGRRAETLRDLPEGWLGLIHPEDRPHVEATMDAVLGSDNPLFDQQFRMQHQDGQWRWMHSRGRVIERDPASGEPLCTAGTLTDITASKEVERRLAERERRLRLITDTISEVFWMADVAIDTMEYVSPAYEQVWQRPVAELYARPKSFLEAVHPDDAQGVARAFLEKGGGLPFEQEYRILRPDGSVRWIWERAFPIKDSAGAVTHYVGTAQDITDRKAAEEEIRRLNQQLLGRVNATAAALAESQQARRESEERFRYAMEASQVGLWDWDLAFGTVAFDPAHAATLAVPQSDRPGLWADVVPPEDLPALATAARQLREQGRCEVEYRVRLRDGSERWVLSRGKVVKRGPASEPLLALGTHTSVDVLKRAEAQRHRLAAIVEAASDFIAVAAPTGQVEYMNPAGRALLGIEPDQSLADAHIQQHHPDWAARRILLEGLPEASRHGQWLGESALLRADGTEVPVSQLVIAQRSSRTGTVAFFATICRDLTERKAIEEQLRQREKSLQAVLDNFPFMVWLKDCDSRFIAVNQAFATAFGWSSPQSLIGRNDLEITSADLAESYRADDRWVLATGSTKQAEELAEVGGQRVWIETYKSPVSVDGRLVGTVGFARDISDRKATEIAVRESEERLRAILEQLPVGVGVLDPQGVYVLSNSVMRQLVGARMPSRDPRQTPRWSARDAAGNLIPPTQWPGARALRGETVTPGIEFAYLSDDGDERLILVSAIPFHGSGGETAGAISVVQDITERKQAEKKLRESQALLQAVLDGSPDPIFLKDRESRLVLANPATFNAIGKPAAACLGKTDDQYYESPADGRAIMANDQRIMASGKSETVEEVVNAACGPRFFISNKAPYRNADGEIVGLIGTARDITERKLAEAKLRESEARFRATFEQAAVGIVHIAPDGRWLRVNRKLCAVLGYGYEELMGADIEGVPLWDGLVDEGPQVARLLARDLDGFAVEKRFARKDGEPIWIAVTASLIWRDDGSPDYFVAVVEDVSARKAAESALQQTLDILEHRVAERTADAESRARALHESERFARATIDALAAHLCVLDERGNILATNRAWDTFARENGGRMASVGTGANYLAVCDAAARAQPNDKTAALVARRLRAMLAGWRESFALEYECHAPDEQRWFVVKASRFAAPGPVRLLLLQENVSAQKQAAKAREESARELARLTAHLASVREEESRRIAGEVHDELGGTLTILKLGLALLKEAPPDPAALPARVDAMIEQADSAIQSVRRIAASLRPPMLDALGLSATIRWQAGEFSRQTGVQTEVQIPESIDLPQERSIAVYRIIQEALTNVARHASATQVRISIEGRDRHLALEIADNGCGYDSAGERRKRSFGVVGMRERAQYLGGQLTIAGAPGGGTKLRLRVPLDWQVSAP